MTSSGAAGDRWGGGPMAPGCCAGSGAVFRWRGCWAGSCRNVAGWLQWQGGDALFAGPTHVDHRVKTPRVAQVSQPGLAGLGERAKAREDRGFDRYQGCVLDKTQDLREGIP